MEFENCSFEIYMLMQERNSFRTMYIRVIDKINNRLWLEIFKRVRDFFNFSSHRFYNSFLKQAEHSFMSKLYEYYILN